MSNVYQRARDARELLENPTFKSIMDEIRQDAVALFVNASSCIDDIAKAHENVRAIETVLQAIQARITEEAMENRKKGLDRG